MTLTLAAQPIRDVPYSYELTSTVDGCGSLAFRYRPGTLSSRVDGYQASVFAACAPVGIVYDDVVTVTAKGTTVTWSVPLAELPESVRPGVLFYDFEAVADVGDPAFGQSYAAPADQALDQAYGDGMWRMR